MNQRPPRVPSNGSEYRHRRPPGQPGQAGPGAPGQVPPARAHPVATPPTGGRITPVNPPRVAYPQQVWTALFFSLLNVLMSILKLFKCRVS